MGSSYSFTLVGNHPDSRTTTCCRWPSLREGVEWPLPTLHLPAVEDTIHFFFWLHWVFTAACGLFSSCGERALLFVAVHGLLIVVASLVVEHRL